MLHFEKTKLHMHTNWHVPFSSTDIHLNPDVGASIFPIN